MHVEEVERNVSYEVYKTPMLAEKDFRTRRFVVIVDMQQQDFSCICGKFQKDGIVCSHVLRVLSHLNMSTLPENITSTGGGQKIGRTYETFISMSLWN